MYEDLVKQLRELEDDFMCVEDGFPVASVLSDAADAIEELSERADVVEVRHGRWELHKDGSGTCQECGCLQKHVWDMDGWQNYCGHCGADMRNGGHDGV